MNIIDMLLKPDKRFLFQCRTDPAQAWTTIPFPKECFRKYPASSSVFGRNQVRGVALPPNSRVLVKDAALYWPDFVAGLGNFQIRSTSDKSAEISIFWQSGEFKSLIMRVASKAEMTRFAVPAAANGLNDLVIEAGEGNIAPVFLGVHQVLDRSELFSRMNGNGVEIGPGPKPQVLPTWRRRVRYVEQATPDMWQTLYGAETPTPINRSLWRRYVVGTADKIPAEPASLDFIFSSHVVEHLANPLGHLAYWATLLKPRGIVAAVIPDRDSCQDYAFPASRLSDFIEEWRHGGMEVTREHFAKWGSVQMPNTPVEEIMESGRSIHVHFYTPANTAELLGQTSAQLGYRRFTVTNSPNHKDFFIVLEK